MRNLIKATCVVVACSVAIPSLALAQMEQPMSGDNGMQRSPGAMPMGKTKSSMMSKKKKAMMMKQKKSMMMKSGGM